MMQGSLAVLHLIAGIHSPVGSSMERWILALEIIALEERLVGTVDVEVEELISLRIFLLLQKPDSTVVDIGTDALEIFSMRLAILNIHLALPVRNHLYRVQPLGNEKHLPAKIEKLGSIILLLEIELFIALFILLSDSIKERNPNLLVALVSRILQEFLHASLCLVQVLARLDLITSSRNLLLLSLHHRWKPEEKDYCKHPYVFQSCHFLISLYNKIPISYCNMILSLRDIFLSYRDIILSLRDILLTYCSSRNNTSTCYRRCHGWQSAFPACSYTCVPSADSPGNQYQPHCRDTR